MERPVDEKTALHVNIPTLSELNEKNKTADVLLWIGCAGSFDDRSKKIALATSKLLTLAKVSFAILGNEEQCTGDPAKRSGNEFLFQVVATKNIETLNSYNIKKIVTFCPHCYNTLKNEYPDLGGFYSVYHHSEFLYDLVESGKLSIKTDLTKKTKVAYHDPCYLGRANNIYKAPRSLLSLLAEKVIEFKRNREQSFCCGAGGAQMFKESEKGTKEINQERAKEAIQTKANIIAIGCPFCKLMLTDGIADQQQDKKSKVEVLDISEIMLSAIEENV